MGKASRRRKLTRLLKDAASQQDMELLESAMKKAMEREMLQRQRDNPTE